MAKKNVLIRKGLLNTESAAGYKLEAYRIISTAKSDQKLPLKCHLMVRTLAHINQKHSNVTYFACA